jgi:NDP-sugar pyrophosphorylase family protein
VRHALAALLLLASTTLPALAAEKQADAPPGGTIRVDRDHKHPCEIRVGPRDKVAQDADLVIPAGADVESAIALRGSVIVRSGARVRKAVAAGGSVRVEDGARVSEDAVAISGDVQVERGGRVDGAAVSLGGRVRIADGGTVTGSVTSLSLQFAGLDLEKELRKQIGAEPPCRVEKE